MAVETPYDTASPAVLESAEGVAAEPPGADPAVLGLLAFSVGGTVLGISLLGYVSPVAQGGSVMPIVLAATGLGVFITTVWSAMLGQTFVAAVFSAFKNADGKTLQEVLDGYGVSASTYLTSWEQFNNGTNTNLCTSSGSSFPIYTSQGSRAIWVCSQFVALQRGTPGYAAVLMIHEELHSLGLGENPPSSGEITSAVQDACGN